MIPKLIREYTDAQGCRWKVMAGTYGPVTVHLGKEG